MLLGWDSRVEVWLIIGMISGKLNSSNHMVSFYSPTSVIWPRPDRSLSRFISNLSGYGIVMLKQQVQ